MRMTGIAVVVCALVACKHNSNDSTVPNELLDKKSSDDSSGSAVATATPASTPAGPDQPALSPADACARVVALSNEQCQWAQRFPPELKDGAICERSLASWFAPETPGHEQLAKMAACWALDCDAAAACMVRVKSGEAPPPPRTCGEEGTGSVYLDSGEWAKRRGVNVARFADVKTSEAEPIEVCGIDGEVEWMTRAACNGGSHPYKTIEQANDSRDSWMARGGRCNSILDRYTVQCPEATYVIHVDRYVCPVGK